MPTIRGIELTIVIPTRDRRAVLNETLIWLARQLGDAEFEVVVVDDGSRDGTPHLVKAFGPTDRFALRLVEQDAAGPAAARNKGIAAARAAVCLFLGDDTWPRPELVDRHARFHRGNPNREAALLGRVVWAEDSSSPFMDWLHETGIQFDYGGIAGREELPARFFYTANVSAKTAFLRAAGGFDESFPFAACEDVELGGRLAQMGLRLAYDPEAVVEHYHPTGLEDALRRLKKVGMSSALLARRDPNRPVPRFPGSRHRLKSGALVALNLPPVRSRRLRRATWRFLCHEAHREGFWAVGPDDGRLSIGGLLARLALRDPATSRPPDRRAHA